MGNARCDFEWAISEAFERLATRPRPTRVAQFDTRSTFRPRNIAGEVFRLRRV
jgi:hypothetical protein